MSSTSTSTLSWFVVLHFPLATIGLNDEEQGVGGHVAMADGFCPEFVIEKYTDRVEIGG